MKILMRIILIALFSCNMLACSKEVAEDEKAVVYGYDQPENTNILIENDSLEFHFNTDTTQFYIVDKKSNTVWNSNPAGVEEDSLADKGSKDNLNSTLIMEYGTPAGAMVAMNNYGYSIGKGIYELEEIENGIRVHYSIGNIEREYYIPIAVPESRMKEFYDKLEKKQQRQIDEYYRRYDIEKLRSTDNKAELLSKYPDLSTERVYVLRDTIASYLKVTLEDMFSSVGYTIDDYELDLLRYDTKKDTKVPVFNITVQYELDGEDLLVTIPMKEISYPSDYPITELQVLPYFGAGSTEEEGYMLVPDGSGGIIRFNNGKQTQNPFYSSLYGWDYGVRRDALIDENRASFPVYGIAKNENSFICILEDGAALATVESDVSRRLHSYNYVMASYTMLHSELMDISAKSDKAVKVYETELPQEDIVQRYKFIPSDNYSKMAETYRNYLIEYNQEFTRLDRNELPIALGIIMATDRVKQRFGFPTTVEEPLTTYEETKGIIDYFYKQGIENISLNLNGWFNEGVVHKVPSDIRLISDLGSKKEFNNLIDEMNRKNIPIYFQSGFQFVHKNSMFDDFVISQDSGKFLSRQVVELTPYSNVWYGQIKGDGNEYHLVKPSYSFDILDEFNDNLNKLGGRNIAFSDIGKDLSSDLNPKSKVSRNEVLNMQKSKLKEMKNEGTSMMFYSGNDYVLPYADFILDMKLDTKGYFIVDEEIPFYQMVLHGLVPYAGKAINLAENYNKNLLKTIESGAALYYVFMDEEVATLQESNYTKYFATDFDKWKEDASRLYKELNEALSGTFDSFIINHEKLVEGVYKTTYENGTYTIVNYNQESYFHESEEVLANNYYIKGGDK